MSASLRRSFSVGKRRVTVSVDHSIGAAHLVRLDWFPDAPKRLSPIARWRFQHSLSYAYAALARDMDAPLGMRNEAGNMVIYHPNGKIETKIIAPGIGEDSQAAQDVVAMTEYLESKITARSAGGEP